MFSVTPRVGIFVPINSAGDVQGTVVTVGRARAVVIGVGSNTAMGKIRDAMSESVAVSICISFATLVSP